MKTVRRARQLGLALTAMLAVGVTSVSAQEQEMPRPDRARMTQFCEAHVAINNARDEFHGKVGRIHEEQGRERARQEMEVQVADILEENELTREQYDAITMLISLDGELRTMFDEIMAELAERGGTAD